MKCPHCGHTDRLHSGLKATLSEPGTCHHDPPDDPCSCPGWHPDLEDNPNVRLLRPNRIARPRPTGGAGRPGTGYVSAMDCDFPDEDDAA